LPDTNKRAKLVVPVALERVKMPVVPLMLTEYVFSMPGSPFRADATVVQTDLIRISPGGITTSHYSHLLKCKDIPSSIDII
jgi:hypothetical protein